MGTPDRGPLKKRGSGKEAFGMPAAAGLDDALTAIEPEDALRAQVYRLIARFLSAAPGQPDLDAAAALQGDETPLGRAIATFAHIAGRSRAADVAEEYDALFIGLPRGELVPYGSYYLTGFLHEKPLAKLRQDMARLGVERDPAVREPEDHIASVTEIMAGLIDGTFGEPASLAEQKHFFETHIGSWAPYFFRDLQQAKSSILYSALGSVGSTFLEVEEGAFALD